MHLTRIAPVGVAHSAHGSIPSTFTNPYAANMHKNEKPPKWDGVKENYLDWKWEFDRFLSRVGELPIATKNQVLEKALPEGEMKRFQKKRDMTQNTMPNIFWKSWGKHMDKTEYSMHKRGLRVCVFFQRAEFESIIYRNLKWNSDSVCRILEIRIHHMCA